MPRSFPDSSGAWSTAFPAVVTPTSIWTFQETASPIDDKIGTGDLAQSTTGISYNQSGGDPTGRVSVSFTDGSTGRYLGATGAPTLGDIPNTVPWSFWIRFKSATPPSARSLVGKGVVAPRWFIRWQPTTGTLRWQIDTPGGGFSPTTVGNYADGNWHDAFLVYVPTEGANGTVHIYIGAEHITTALSNAAWTSQGGIIAATEFRVGAAGSLTPSAEHVSYAALWSSTALSAADIAALLTDTLPGTFEVGGSSTAEFASGLLTAPGSFESLGSGSLSAGPGIVELQGSFESGGESFQQFNGMSAGEGIVDVGGTGGFSASGDSASFGNFDLLASGDLSLVGQLGLLGSFDVSGVGSFIEAADQGFFFNEASGGVVFTDDVYFPVTGGSLNQTIKSLKTGDYFVHRAAQGSVDDRGRYVSNIRSVFRIEASVQPVSGRNMQVQADGTGQHGTEQKVIYCTKALYPRTETHDPDIIMLPNLENGEFEPYEVYRCDRWDHWGDVHYIAYASRIVIP